MSREELRGTIFLLKQSVLERDHEILRLRTRIKLLEADIEALTEELREKSDELREARGVINGGSVPDWPF